MAELGHECDPDTVHDLEKWVRNKVHTGAVFTSGTEVSVRWIPAENLMNAVEIIDVVLSNIAGLGGLAMAVAGWRRSRSPAPPAVIIVIGEHRIPITDANPEEIRRLTAAAEGPAPGPGAA